MSDIHCGYTASNNAVTLHDCDFPAPVQVAQVVAAPWMKAADFVPDVDPRALLSGEIVVGLLVALLLIRLLRLWRLLGLVYVPNDKVCIVTKKWGRKRLANGRIIATDGEAGLQADTLTPGMHFGFWPWQYSVEFAPLTTIEPDHSGHVTMIDGEAIPPGRLLARHVECNDFQDLTAFIRNKGQRGPQSSIIRPGTYRINTKAMTVDVSDEALIVEPNKIAIITTNDGNPLESGEIAGPIIENHSSFQDADAFITNGGRRGLQSQVLMPGIYYVNNWFIDSEEVDLQDVPIGHVGVVVSFVGPPGEDTSGADFTHGHIVKQGQKGVWDTPLQPGRYPLNTRTTHLQCVPTTNFVLNWIDGVKEAHGLDASLKSIVVRSSDGFSYPIEVSQILHIAAENAPRVIARFGTVLNFVTQVLEPIIDNWFRNAAQPMKLMDFLMQRKDIQERAEKYIRDELAKYDVEAVATPMGDISPPDKLMSPIQDKEVALQQKTMFDAQKEAQAQRQDMEEAKAKADTMGQIVQASRNVETAKLNAESAVAKADGEAQARVLEGSSRATATLATGNAEAEVLDKKVKAIGQGNWASMEILGKLADSKTPIVPTIVAGGEGGLPNALMASLLGRMAVIDAAPVATDAGAQP